MAKDRKGNDKKEYPKLVKVGDRKIKVMNKAEEDKLLNKEENKPEEKKEEKKAGWGNNP